MQTKAYRQTISWAENEGFGVVAQPEIYVWAFSHLKAGKSYHSESRAVQSLRCAAERQRATDEKGREKKTRNEPSTSQCLAHFIKKQWDKDIYSKHLVDQ